MLKNKIKSAILIVAPMVTSLALAHVSPEHVLGLSHGSANTWSLFEIGLLISTLVIFVGLLLKKQKTEESQ